MDNGSKYLILVLYEILCFKCYLKLLDALKYKQNIALLMIHLWTPGTLLWSESTTVTTWHDSWLCKRVLWMVLDPDNAADMCPQTRCGRPKLICTRNASSSLQLVCSTARCRYCKCRQAKLEQYVTKPRPSSQSVTTRSRYSPQLK